MELKHINELTAEKAKILAFENQSNEFTNIIINIYKAAQVGMFEYSVHHILSDDTCEKLRIHGYLVNTISDDLLKIGLAMLTLCSATE